MGYDSLDFIVFRQCASTYFKGACRLNCIAFISIFCDPIVLLILEACSEDEVEGPASLLGQETAFETKRDHT